MDAYWIEVIILYGGFLLLVVGVLVAIVYLVKKISKPEQAKNRITLGFQLLVLLVFATALILPGVFKVAAQPILTPFLNWSADLILQSQGRN